MEQQQQPKKEAIFKQRAVARDRTYFFDVRESVKGSKYLIINEAKKKGEKYEYSKIMIFEDHLQMFADGFNKVYEFINGKEQTA